MRWLVNRVLSQSQRRFVRESLISFNLILLKIFSKHPILASIYYLALSREFYREHYSVMQGRLAYLNSLKAAGESSVLLRRNVHRLEKGLIMRPRKPVFAEAFIAETVDCYISVVGAGELCQEEKSWATDVLNEYFLVVEESPITVSARQVYLSAVRELTESTGSSPYPYHTLPDSSVSSDQLERLYTRRRSVRWYNETPVPMEKIQRAIDIAALAPSACNRQPYRFVVATNKEQAVKIAQCAGGTRGFAENLPAVIAVVGDLSSYPFERDRHLIYIDGGLVSMQLMLALETLGLSSCPINWPDVKFAENQIRKILDLPPHKQVIMLIAVGYADRDGGIPYSQKKQGRLITEEVV